MNKQETGLQLARKTTVVMALTLLSRLGGFVRDVILAQIFGAGAAFDAFVVAFKIPNLMRRLFGEGAFAHAFVPTLMEYRIQHSHADVKAFLDSVAGFLSAAALLAVIIGEIFAPVLVTIFAPGFIHDSARYLLAVKLIRITQPYLFSIALVALAGAILNTYQRFAISAFTPVLLNLVLILVACLWTPHVGPESRIIVLAWGVFISGVIQLIIQWPVLKRLRLLPKPAWSGWREDRVKRVFQRIIPALLGVSVAQVSLLIDNLFASFLPVGSLSWLYYSDRLIYLPLGVIGVALATVVMPSLSTHHHRRSDEAFAATLDWGLRCVMTIAVPAAAGLMVLAGPVLATLMYHGAFTVRDVEMTQRSLIAFAAGLPAWMLIKMMASAFYARHDIKTPAQIAVFAILLNIVFNFVLVHPFLHAGLALSTTLASWFNALLLFVFSLKKNIFQPQPGWMRVGWGIVSSSILMVGFLFWCAGDLSQWLAWRFEQGSWRLTALIGLSILIYLAGLRLSGLRWKMFKIHPNGVTRCN